MVLLSISILSALKPNSKGMFLAKDGPNIPLTKRPIPTS